MTLQTLIESQGSTLGDASRACFVDLALFLRVDADRQPIPRVVAERLAAFLGISVATVIVEAPRWTNDVSESALRPVPARPGIDPDSSPTYRATSVLPTPKPDVPQIWAFVPDPSSLIADTYGSRFSRDDGVEMANITIPRFIAATRTAVLNGRIWTVATQISFAPMVPTTRHAIAIDYTAKTQVVEGTYVFSRPVSICAEPVSSTVWVADQTAGEIVRLNLTNGNDDLHVSTAPYEPVDICGFGGVVYALCRDAGTFDGFVLSFDAETGAAIGVSASSLAEARGITETPDGTLYIVGAGAGLSIYNVDPISFAFVQRPVNNAPLIDPEWIYADETRLWVSDRTAPPQDARLLRVDRTTGDSVAAVFASTAITGAAPGRALSDGVYMWVPDSQGLLWKVNPETMESLIMVRGSQSAPALAIVR